MSLYVRVYVFEGGTGRERYVAHRISSFYPVQGNWNNDPEDNSTEIKLCVETHCAQQLVVDAVHTDWPEAELCPERDDGRSS